jgi:hypothetical protein
MSSTHPHPSHPFGVGREGRKQQKKMKNVLSEEARLKIAIAINQGVFTLVHNVDTGEILSFVSIRKAPEFLGIHQSSIAKSIQLKGFLR